MASATNISRPISATDDPLYSRRAAKILFAALTAVFLVSIVYNAPDGNYFTLCAFKNLTGLPCPGCGLAHSFCALAKGRVSQAFGYNALGPPSFVFAVLLWARCGLILGHREDISAAFDGLLSRVRMGWILVVAFSVYGVGRIIYLLIDRPSVLQDGYIGQLLR